MWVDLGPMSQLSIVLFQVLDDTTGPQLPLSVGMGVLVSHLLLLTFFFLFSYIFIPSSDFLLAHIVK